MVDISVGVGVGNEVNGTAGRGGGAVALKGLRLLSIDRGADGFGFHMFTNKELKGQYIKSVMPNGPADLAGMIPGDHVLAVDGNTCIEESHHAVVERIRKGDGKEKKLLVIDADAERDMKAKEQEINPDNAIVMIPRAPPPPSPEQPSSEPEETGKPSLDLASMNRALPRRKQDVKKARDWSSSVKAYNDL